jgi:hypothetical protein
VSKEISLFSASLPVENLSQGLRALANMQAMSLNGVPFLRFTKVGEWEFGPENVPVEDGEIWAVNPQSFYIGVIGWQGGQVVGESMFPIHSPQRVNPDTLTPINTGKPGDGWVEQITVSLKNIEDGTEVLFKTSSRGGKKACGLLANAMVAQIESNPAFPVPLVELQRDSYVHKKYGKILEPKFHIVGWADMEGRPEKKRKQQLV